MDTEIERETRRSPQRLPESYPSVSAWYADYRGFVPLPMAHALSQLTERGMSFPDAYLHLLRKGQIVEVQPWPRDLPDRVPGEPE